MVEQRLGMEQWKMFKQIIQIKGCPREELLDVLQLQTRMNTRMQKVLQDISLERPRP